MTQEEKEMKNQFNFGHWHNSNEEQPDGNRVIVCYHTPTNMFGDVGKYSLLKPNYRWAYLEDLDPEYGKTMDTCEQKPTCEEDERRMFHVLECLKNGWEKLPTDILMYEDWFKSIKKRVQPKREWSEEEKARIDKIIDVIDWAEEKGYIRYSDWEDYVGYVKSLKPQNAWKPSNEQIEALLKLEEMHVLEHEKNQENAHLYMVVKSIREQLLKLREK